MLMIRNRKMECEGVSLHCRIDDLVRGLLQCVKAGLVMVLRVEADYEIALSRLHLRLDLLYHIKDGPASVPHLQDIDAVQARLTRLELTHARARAADEEFRRLLTRVYQDVEPARQSFTHLASESGAAHAARRMSERPEEFGRASSHSCGCRGPGRPSAHVAEWISPRRLSLSVSFSCAVAIRCTVSAEYSAGSCNMSEAYRQRLR